MTDGSKKLFWVALILLLAGCGGRPAKSYAPPADDPPPPCSENFASRAGVLNLPPTQTPAIPQTNKSEPLRIASDIVYDRPVANEGRWTDFNDGWSSLALRVSSVGAHSIAVHLSGIEMPPNGEIWLCAADGSNHQGPYRQTTDGELWTPVVPGPEGWLEVLVPSGQREKLKVNLAEIFGGFR